ncbi:DMT family transporter [Granulosicoccus sp.]|nr:DMT family transporter [Granulosicoccus sp.]MDB4223387.1 DMT family transporter [Granulosicoccus sp.]
MSARDQNTVYIDYIWLVSLSILFGLSFTLTSIAVRDIPPISLAAGRLLIAFLMLYPLMRLNGQKMPDIGPIWIALLASGLFGNALPFALISWGQVNVQAGLTAIFMAVMPLATILLAHVFTDEEKLDRWKFIGVMFGLVGVIVLMGWSALNSIGDDLIRQSAILLAAICYAINAIITRKLTRLPRWSAMSALMFAGSLWLVPVSLMVDSPWQIRPSLPSGLSLLFLAIGPTAIATVMILRIVDRQGASFLSQINFLVPIVGMVFGVLMLNESFPANAYVALLIILAGIGISRLSGRQP